VKQSERLKSQIVILNSWIGWKGQYRIEGGAFVYVDQASGRAVTIDGYPANKIVQQLRSKRAKINPMS
jgi:predicted house-cleaning NTP pyrophosphatase (Maf/HAM1 superfamily)